MLESTEDSPTHNMREHICERKSQKKCPHTKREGHCYGLTERCSLRSAAVRFPILSVTRPYGSSPCAHA